MAPSCYCTGSLWIMDDPDLGACTCVTPKLVQDARAATTMTSEILANQMERNGDQAEALTRADDVIAGALAHLQAYFRHIGLPSDPIKLSDASLQAAYDALKSWEAGQ